MPGYSDVSDLYDQYNLTGAVETAVPGLTVSQDDDVYQVSYTVFTLPSDVSGSGYYTTSSPEYTNLVTSYDYSPAIAGAITNIMTGDPSNDYSVLPTDVANVAFYTPTSGTGIITFGQVYGSLSWFNSGLTDPDGDPGNPHGTSITYGYSPFATSWEHNTALYGDIWINTEHQSSDFPGSDEWTAYSSIVPGTFAYQALLHEVGHALGLTDAAGTVLDSQQYSIMSYNALPGMTGSSFVTSVAPDGLQLYDIAAIQAIYGRNYDTRPDDDVYSSDTAFASTLENSAFIYTIWDGEGTDVIDATGFAHHALIDLRQGNFSSIGNAADDTFNAGTINGFAYDEGQAENNVAIAYYTVIENAIGTAYADTLIGNEWNNVLFGGAGNDQIYGDGITYDGTAGFHASDSARPGPNAATDLSGNDVLIGGLGDDTLFGGLGNDVLDGGYNKTDIDNATSGWSTYWDSAGEITGSNNYNGVAYSNISTSSDGSDIADYSKLPLGTSHTGISVTFSNSVDYGTVSKGASGALGTDKLFSIETVIGTAQNDTFNHTNGEAQTFFGGAGSDGYHFSAGDTGSVDIVESYDKGVDTLYLDPSFTANYIYAPDYHDDSTQIGITMDLFYGSSELLLNFSTSKIADGYGIEFIQIGSDLIPAAEIQPWLESFSETNTAYSVSLSDLAGDISSWETSTYWTGGTGGTGAGGGVLPTYDGSGNVTSMALDPAVGGSPISAGIADVIDNPLVLTSFSQSYSSGTYTSTASWQTYEQAFDFVNGIDASDVRLTLSGSQGYGALTISIDSIDFSLTISNFETGQVINGIEVYNSTVHGIIQDASGATLVATGTNTFGGSYLTVTGLDVDTSDSVTEHYYLEALNFAGGGGIDLTAPITFTGSDSGETLTGLDGRADTIYGMGGDDYIYAYGGDDTLIGGDGNDQLYGGTGNDTYIFAAGWGSDIVHENTGEGTDTIHFTGIAPSDIRMYTDSYGYLHLVQISDPSNSVTIYASVTGNNNAESTVGSYVESVTFDSSYGTTWDLTGGLNINGDNSGDNLYGTAYGDVITGGTGADYIYGNAGNDTIIGGTGADNLYGGPGNDTYVFSAGFGNATVHENTGEGTDTIHLSGINPANVRLYTDAYGYLHIVDTTNPSYNISVVASTTGDNNAESTIGAYVESITFDSSYSTTWDLTGGLNIKGDNSGDNLMGTAYNDVITGGTGADYIYGNAGDDTIIGGTGTDHLYGGPGNDTYVFSSGFGNATVQEYTGQGTDTIHLAGIDPANVHLYTDPYGELHIVDTTNPSYNITVYAGTTGDNNAESTIGSYVESITFDSSYATTWDLTGGLHITGDNSGDNLMGTAYNDVITGGTGADYIYGNAGNDTIIGGTGTDHLYGGPGNDTYVFSSGFGNATVQEYTGQGTDTIHLSGIDPADVRLWTDAYGYLHIQDTADTSHNITVIADVTGYNTSESTIGSYVESITFDSSYGTTWDLTGGLNITGDNSGDNLYGTAYNDVITGGTGADYIYGNAGNDTIIGGTGADNLYGGPGNDTYVFSSGFGNATVHESLGQGTDTIHLSGIDPADVRLWTDAYGFLHIQDTSDTSHNITVNADVTGSNTCESTIGSYVESITFDSSYSTTWDLTGGLNITGNNSGTDLYGTAYGDTITGGSGSEYLYGNAGDDVLYGAGGNDHLVGGPGADTFLFESATAESGVATITDFNTGQGDKIDIANVISTYDPATMAIANFVQLVTSGSDTQVKVDTDGSGTSYTQIATIQGVSGLSLSDLITDGNLIVHHT